MLEMMCFSAIRVDVSFIGRPNIIIARFYPVGLCAYNIMFAESLNAVVGQACSSLVFVHCFSLLEGEGSFLSFFKFFL